jgi:hypothetical protein
MQAAGGSSRGWQRRRGCFEVCCCPPPEGVQLQPLRTMPCLCAGLLCLASPAYWFDIGRKLFGCLFAAVGCSGLDKTNIYAMFARWLRSTLSFRHLIIALDFITCIAIASVLGTPREHSRWLTVPRPTPPHASLAASANGATAEASIRDNATQILLSSLFVQHTAVPPFLSDAHGFVDPSPAVCENGSKEVFLAPALQALVVSLGLILAHGALAVLMLIVLLLRGSRITLGGLIETLSAFPRRSLLGGIALAASLQASSLVQQWSHDGLLTPFSSTIVLPSGLDMLWRYRSTLVLNFAIYNGCVHLLVGVLQWVFRGSLQARVRELQMQQKEIVSLVEHVLRRPPSEGRTGDGRGLVSGQRRYSSVSVGATTLVDTRSAFDNSSEYLPQPYASALGQWSPYSNGQPPLYPLTGHEIYPGYQRPFAPATPADRGVDNTNIAESVIDDQDVAVVPVYSRPPGPLPPIAAKTKPPRAGHVADVSGPFVRDPMIPLPEPHSTGNEELEAKSAYADPSAGMRTLMAAPPTVDEDERHTTSKEARPPAFPMVHPLSTSRGMSLGLNQPLQTGAGPGAAVPHAKLSKDASFVRSAGPNLAPFMLRHAGLAAAGTWTPAAAAQALVKAGKFGNTGTSGNMSAPINLSDPAALASLAASISAASRMAANTAAAAAASGNLSMETSAQYMQRARTLQQPLQIPREEQSKPSVQTPRPHLAATGSSKKHLRRSTSKTHRTIGEQANVAVAENTGSITMHSL